MFGKAVHGGVFKLLRRNLSNLVDISPEVGSALKENKAVVALESTIITHGMPYPTNHQTAVSVENIIRNQVKSLWPI
jgi:pseudouridine-5'-phosphate glycosidase